MSLSTLSLDVSMHSKWSSEKIETVGSRVSEKYYEQLLDELADILYNYFCQQNSLATYPVEVKDTDLLEGVSHGKK